MREVPEWRGSSDDVRIPDRVRLRVYVRAGGRCDICSRSIRTGERWECDHKSALANGGEHRESNLQVLCGWCHKAKTKTDIAEKSATYQSKKRHLGLKKAKHPMPGSKASGWKRKMDGTVVKR
jgi:5-methylcytosine-specific restriction protein A